MVWRFSTVLRRTSYYAVDAGRYFFARQAVDGEQRQRTDILRADSIGAGVTDITPDAGRL